MAGRSTIGPHYRGACNQASCLKPFDSKAFGEAMINLNEFTRLLGFHAILPTLGMMRKPEQLILSMANLL